MKMFNYDGKQTTDFDEMAYCYGTAKELTDLTREQTGIPYEAPSYMSVCPNLEHWFVRAEEEGEFDILCGGLVRAIKDHYPY